MLHDTTLEQINDSLPSCGLISKNRPLFHNNSITTEISVKPMDQQAVRWMLSNIGTIYKPFYRYHNMIIYTFRKARSVIYIKATYFLRSKAVILLPTGLISTLPSGENSTLPFLYTVPRRLENYNIIMIALLYQYELDTVCDRSLSCSVYVSQKRSAILTSKPMMSILYATVYSTGYNMRTN